MMWVIVAVSVIFAAVMVMLNSSGQYPHSCDDESCDICFYDEVTVSGSGGTFANGAYTTSSGGTASIHTITTNAVGGGGGHV